MNDKNSQKWVLTPKDYLTLLNQPQTKNEEKAIERSITKSNPYNSDNWVEKIVKKFGWKKL